MHITTYKSILTLLFLYLGTHCLFSQDIVLGSIPLDLAIDARSAALGGKLASSLSPNEQAATYNPALVDSASIGQVYVSYLNYYAGIKVGSVDAVINNKGKRTVHAGARFSSFGKFDGYDPSGVSTGDFSGGDYFLQAGVSWKLDSVWSAGITGWSGFRNLARENAGVIGVDVGIMGRWDERYLAVGVLISGLGQQFAGTGSQPVGSMPINVQAGFTKGFDNAPFTFFLQMEHLEKWGLAPAGTYDDGLDPLTGEVIPNQKWEFGDQLSRHLRGGVEVNLGSGLMAQMGYDHRRRLEMEATGRRGTNGFSIGLAMKIGDVDLGLARNTYHFAGSSTHLSIVFSLPGQ
ncbi:MAG: hypothetical protein COA49_02050 [Bacteroidetes bacterium]|nr:MAG: hypothetical protein COA49_02050 [Bacteroidota bacterium]